MRRQSDALFWSAGLYLVAGFVIACAAGCGEPAQDDDGTAMAIGAIVPFTGVSAASGANYERAMLLAVEYLNREAATGGTRFRLVAQDSHSTLDRTRKALDELFSEEVVGVIGPGDVELVQSVRAAVGVRSLVHVLPTSVTLSDFAGDTSGQLIRPAPAAEYVGCAVANRVYGDLDERMVVVHARDPYRRAFASAAVESFESYRFAARIGHALALELPADSDKYLEIVSAAARFEPDTIVLAADAPVAAGFVRAWSTLRRDTANWFFEPGLRSEEFLRNVVVSSVDESAGISLAVPDQADAFHAAYAKRWDGEVPLIESHNYFDAVIVIGLATLQAWKELGRRPTPEEVAPHALSVVRAPGVSVRWDELGRAVELVSQGQPIHYTGAGGRWVVDATGASDGTAAIFGFWRVRSGKILSEGFGACPAGTIDVP